MSVGAGGSCLLTHFLQSAVGECVGAAVLVVRLDRALRPVQDRPPQNTRVQRRQTCAGRSLGDEPSKGRSLRLARQQMTDCTSQFRRFLRDKFLPDSKVAGPYAEWYWVKVTGSVSGAVGEPVFDLDSESPRRCYEGRRLLFICGLPTLNRRQAWSSDGTAGPPSPRSCLSCRP